MGISLNSIESVSLCSHFSFSYFMNRLVMFKVTGKGSTFSVTAAFVDRLNIVANRNVKTPGSIIMYFN